MTLGYLFVAIVTIIGYLLFIPEYGIWAAAWWTLIAEALIGILTFIVVVRASGYRPKFIMAIKSIFASLIMYAGLTFLPDWHVLILITLGCFIYYIALTAVGGPKIKEALKLFLPEKPPIAQP